MTIIQNERLCDVFRQSLWMSYSDTQPLSDTGAIPDRGSVAYISGFMERFVRSENLFTPDGFDTLTQRFFALHDRGESFYSREVADFALFNLGMVPERLKAKGNRKVRDRRNAGRYGHNRKEDSRGFLWPCGSARRRLFLRERPVQGRPVRRIYGPLHGKEHSGGRGRRQVRDTACVRHRRGGARVRRGPDFRDRENPGRKNHGDGQKPF